MKAAKNGKRILLGYSGMAVLIPNKPPRQQRTWLSTIARPIALSTVLLAYASGALAVLGQSLQATSNAATASVPASVQLQSTTAATASLYTQTSTLLDTGTRVTEYATPAGMVFAIAWQGPVLPDLGTLLGSYFSTFKTEAERSRSQRNLGTPLRIETSNLVVRSRGRMRNFSGNAYAPALIPAGLVMTDVLP